MIVIARQKRVYSLCHLFFHFLIFIFHFSLCVLLKFFSSLQWWWYFCTPPNTHKLFKFFVYIYKIRVNSNPLESCNSFPFDFLTFLLLLLKCGYSIRLYSPGRGQPQFEEYTYTQQLCVFAKIYSIFFLYFYNIIKKCCSLDTATTTHYYICE